MKKLILVLGSGRLAMAVGATEFKEHFVTGE
jgi:hypothetical protein